MIVLHIARGGAKLAVAACAASVAFLAIPFTAASAATSSGIVTLVDPATNQPVTNNQALSSGQTFLPTLPANAVCPANSGTNGEKVYSFMVPHGTDPTTLSFTSGLPSNSFTTGSGDTPGFYASNGTYWIQNGGTTAPNGAPNSIVQMNWGAAIQAGNLSVADLTSQSTWDTGIICVKSTGAPETVFWDPPISFSASSSDPNGFSWTANPAGGPIVPEAPLAIALPIGGLIVLGVGVVVNRRRHTARVNQVSSAA
jgi:hypothetical protein